MENKQKKQHLPPLGAARITLSDLDDVLDFVIGAMIQPQIDGATGM